MELDEDVRLALESSGLIKQKFEGILKVDRSSAPVETESALLNIDLADAIRRYVADSGRRTIEPVDLSLAILMSVDAGVSQELPRRLEQLGVDVPRAIDELQKLLDRPSPLLRFGRKPSLEMLADIPVSDESLDTLNFGPYVSALAGVIDNPRTSTPLTVAINGPWGSGKTSLALMLERRLSKRAGALGVEPPLFVWFHAWLHDDAPDLGAALAARVGSEAGRRRRWRTRILHPLPPQMLNPQERFRRKSLVGAIGVTITATLIYLFRGAFAPNQDLIDALTGGYGPTFGSVLLVLWVLLLGWSRFFGAAQSAARFLTSPRSEAGLGGLSEVREELGRLIKNALQGSRRLVVFVDDLERCEPPRAIEICEIANQLLDHRDVVVIYLADMRSIEASVEMKYANVADAERRLMGFELEGEMGTRPWWGRAYLQKIVQFQIDVPVLAPDTGPRLLRGFTSPTPNTADIVSESSLSWIERVFAVWERRDSRPLQKSIAAKTEARIAELTEGDLLNPSELESRLMAEGLSQDPELVGQLVQRHLTDDSLYRTLAEEVVMPFVSPNPRAVKRMANRLRFQLSVAQGLGILDSDSDRMAQLVGKWSLLTEWWPEVIARMRAGRLSLAALEAAARSSDGRPVQNGVLPAKQAGSSADDSARSSGDWDFELTRAGLVSSSTQSLRKILASDPLFGSDFDLFAYHGIMGPDDPSASDI
jgi:hypothetical protein